MKSDALYVVVIEGKPRGPYTTEELKDLNIKSGTFVKTPEMDDYKEAHAVPELQALFKLRELVTPPQYFASFDLRLFAAAVDYLFVSMVYVFLVLCSFLFIDNTASRWIVFLTFSPMIIIGKFLYSCFADASAKQGTIGKRLINIKVTDLMGKRISLVNSFGRNIAKLASTAPVFIGYLYSFLNKKQQCFHDILSDTLVIKDRLI